MIQALKNNYKQIVENEFLGSFVTLVFVIVAKPEDVCQDRKRAGGDKAEPTSQKSQTHLPGHG